LLERTKPLSERMRIFRTALVGTDATDRNSKMTEY
jgi:hypothetical protein